MAHLAILRTTDYHCSSAALDGRENVATVYELLSYTESDALANTSCENVESTVRKRGILFARFVARTDNERLPKRVMMFGEVDGGKGCSGGQGQEDWMDCLERDLSLLNLPTGR